MNKILAERHKGSIDAIEKILVEGKHFPKLSADRRSKIAILLENFTADLRQKALRNEEGMGAVGRASLLEGKKLLEGAGMTTIVGATATGGVSTGNGTGLAEVGPFTKFGINLITAVMTQTVADTLVSVQPMTNRVGEVRFLQYKYASAKAPTQRGDLLASALEFNGGNVEYSSETVAGEELADTNKSNPTANLAWTPVRPGSVELHAIVTSGSTLEIFRDKGDGHIYDTNGSSQIGTIDYLTGAIKLTNKDLSSTYTGNLKATYEYANTEVNPVVPEVKTEIAVMPMQAKSRKLKTVYSFDAAYDLQADYGFDIDAELVAYFSAEIAHEIDGEIINDLRAMAAGNSETISPFYTVPPTGVSQADHDDSFWNKIVEGGNIIFKRLRRGRVSWVVAGISVCSVIETMRKFVPSEVDAIGPHICGTINNIPVIKNPFLPADEYIVGYKGSQLFDAGYIYAPYMPITVLDIVMPDGFSFGKGFATAYGKAKLNPNCYVTGKIIASAKKD